MRDHLDILHEGKRTVFPAKLQRSFESLKEDWKIGRVSPALIMSITDQLSNLPVSALVKVADEFPSRSGLYRSSWEQATQAPLPLIDLVKNTHRLEYLFLFHGNGHLREAALHKLDSAIPNAFLFAAIAYRLNDWVKPVRQAAFQTALRIFPKTDPDIIAEAAMFLLRQKRLWERGKAEVIILDEAFSRADVTDRLVTRLKVAKEGAPGRVLIAALSDDRVDSHLMDIARSASEPAVRGVALHALLKGEARWPVGREKKWIDKSMGLFRHVTTTKSRPLNSEHSIDFLITMGAADKAASVRRVAMQTLVDNSNLWQKMQSTIQVLASDRSHAVRLGIDYILRQQIAENR